MVDLHCHILPQIDDGPKNVKESVELVKMEQACGTSTIFATPHFIPDISNDVFSFCEKRKNSLKILREALSEESIEINIMEAAEVAISAELPETEGIENLKYAGTDYMLIELPRYYYYDWIPQVLYNLRLEGIIPILAHVERFKYIQEKPDILYELVNSGCLAQVNASFFIKSGHAGIRFMSKLIKRNLVHIVATDTHSVAHRPPQLKEAMEIIRSKWGNDKCNYFKENASSVAECRHPELRTPQKQPKFALWG